MEQEGEVSGTTLSRQESDAVSHPSHYAGGGIEAKDALKSAYGRQRALPDGVVLVGLRVQVPVAMDAQERLGGPEEVQAVHRLLIEEVS